MIQCIFHKTGPDFYAATKAYAARNYNEGGMRGVGGESKGGGVMEKSGRGLHFESLGFSG